MKYRIFVLVLAVLSFSALAKDVYVSAFHKDDYVVQVLRLALSYSSDTDYKVKFFDHKVPKQRIFKMIANNDMVDVVASGATPDKLRYAKPILFPLTKGAIGWRATLINKQNLEQISNVTSFEQFATLRAGQKLQWSDTKILRHNGINLGPQPIRTVCTPC